MSLPPMARRGRRRANRADPERDRRLPSEKHAELAQKLGQLQPFIAVLPQECMGI
jgi:hypothetical protein